jgi:hypothetical protein
MGDATLKPSSGDDLVLSNDDGSAKIEVNEGGDVEITPSTSLKVTLGSDSGDDLNVDSGKLVVEGDTGNVGIGGSPSTLLHLVSAQPELKLQSNGSSQTATISMTASDGADAIINSTHSSGKLKLQTNSSDKLTIDSSGNVGIGASSGLLGKLHIQEFGSVAGSVSSGADTLVLQNNGGHGGLSVVTNNTSTASLHLGDTDTSSMGGLQYDNNANTLSVLSGGSERIRIDASGNTFIKSTHFEDHNGIEVGVNFSVSRNGVGQGMGFKTLSVAFANSTTPQDTGIRINQGGPGMAALLIVKGNYSTGTGTGAGAYVINFHFNGDNVPAIHHLGGDTFSTITLGKTGSSPNETMTIASGSSFNLTYSFLLFS